MLTASAKAPVVRRSAMRGGESTRATTDSFTALGTESVPHEVIVIGGGVSGLAAAVRLAAAGAPVRLMEARRVLGGRATSFSDPRTGEVFDNGQHALMGCYRETFAFLDAIGARHLVEMSPSLDVTSIDEHGGPSELRCPRWPPPLHLLGGVLSWSGVGWSDRLQVLAAGPVLLRARRAAARPGAALPCLPGETVLDWLVRHGQGPRVRALLWEPLALAALNQPIDRAAAPTFVRVLGRVFGPGPTDASVVLPRCRCRGSSAFRRSSSHAAPSSNSTRWRAWIARGWSGPGRHRPGRGVDVRGAARHPRDAVAHVVDDAHGDLSPLAETLNAARNTQASPIVTVTLTYDRPVLKLPMLGLPARPFQWAFDTAALGGCAPGARVALVSSGADAVLRLSNDVAATLARDVFAAAVPAARVASLLSARVIREPRATFSLAPGAAAAPEDAHGGCRPVPRERLGRHRPARDHRRRGGSRTPRRRRGARGPGRPALARRSRESNDDGRRLLCRALPGTRAQGAEPGVVRRSPRAAPAKRAAARRRP